MRDWDKAKEQRERVTNEYEFVLSALTFAVIGFVTSNETRPAIGVAVGLFGWISFWAGYETRRQRRR